MTLALTGREAAFAQQVTQALKTHFTIHPEVWGTHPTGKRLRIDAIAVPHDRDQWARPDVALGIEFKAPTDRPSEKRDRKGNAKIISQCIDYSLVEWDGFGVQPIFFCPGFTEIRSWDQRDPFFGLSDGYSEGFEHGKGYLMAAVLGQNNVGELVHSHHLGWAFLINGRHRLWSQRLGIRTGGLGEARLNRLTRKVGSR